MRLVGMGLGVALLALAGCGDDDSSGPSDGRGRAEAYVRDNPGSSAALRPSVYASDAQPFNGTFATNASVSVSADGQTWVDLGSPNGITINLQRNDSTTVHGESDLRAGTYAHVRLTLRNAAVMVRAGATFGSLTLTGDVQLNVGGADREIVIQKSVTPFTVTANSRVAIAFELNSEMWINQQNAQDRTVDDAEVQAVATAMARVR